MADFDLTTSPFLFADVVEVDPPSTSSSSSFFGKVVSGEAFAYRSLAVVLFLAILASAVVMVWLLREVVRVGREAGNPAVHL